MQRQPEFGGNDQSSIQKELEPLPETAEITPEYIEHTTKQMQSFKQFHVVKDFSSPEDERILTIEPGQKFNSFAFEGSDWACGFLDHEPNKFGYVPVRCLKLEKETRQGNRSRNASPNASQVRI
jgi:hypothetical protein